MTDRNPAMFPQEPEAAGGWIPIGEGISPEDVHLAAVTLYEHHLEGHWAHPVGHVPELRRFLENDPGGQLLMVMPRDAQRALALVGDRLAPVQNWPDVPAYLDSRPTDDMLKILDFEGMWSEPTRTVARKVLERRGLVYPPTAVSSKVLPVVVLLVPLLMGPFAGLFMRKVIERKDRAPSGGRRPHYDAATQKRAGLCLLYGVLFWVSLCVVGVILWIVREIQG